MTSSLGNIYQSIEILSKEKGIDPQIIRDAVKDAMLVAARKHFHANEELVAEMAEGTGTIQIFGVKRVADPVTDPDKEISLEDARGLNPAVEMGGEIRFAKPLDALGRISAQTFKQVILQKVREAERENIRPGGRTGDLRGQAPGRSGPGGGPGQNRSAHSQERAIAPGKLQRGRPHPLRHPQRREGR
jgi:N utilization substance protein A